MHVSGDSSDRRPRRSASVLFVLVLLLAVVAIASSGHVPTGSNDTRRPSYQVADTVVSLILIIVLVGSVGIFYVFYLQRTNDYRQGRSGLAGGNRRTLMTLLGILLFITAVSILLAVRSHRHNPARSGLAGLGTGEQTGAGGGYTPHFATVPVAVILGAAGIAAIAAYVSFRAGRQARQPAALESALALTLADVLGETLDDLRNEPDPRVAVIAAYARLERTLTAFGIPRREADAPAEYLRRILVDLEVGVQHASRLTQLFEHAKFSLHQVGPELKAEAIELLEAIRVDLQAAEAARRAMPVPATAGGQPA